MKLDSDKVMRLMDAADNLSARFDKMCAKKDADTHGSGKYEAAYQKWKKVSAEFSSAQADYRSRKIGDKEFLAAREKFKQAEKEFDKVEAEERR